MGLAHLLDGIALLGVEEKMPCTRQDFGFSDFKRLIVV